MTSSSAAYLTVLPRCMLTSSHQSLQLGCFDFIQLAIETYPSSTNRTFILNIQESTVEIKVNKT